jgi:hypothetical protein
MATKILNPFSGFQPLGTITVATAGVPVLLSQNIGTYYSAASGGPKGSEYAMQFGQLWLRASAANTGNIYLVHPGQPATNTDAIIWYLEPGEFLFIGSDSPSRNSYSLESFELDADTGGNTVLVTGVIGG